MPMERERYPDDWERIATEKKEAEIIYVMDRARRSRGLSMGCVAQRAGINPYYYSTIVRGMHSPTLHMLCRILRVLGLELTLRRIKTDEKTRWIGVNSTYGEIKQTYSNERLRKERAERDEGHGESAGNHSADGKGTGHRSES